MINTCGVFVLDADNRVLCCHPTNAPYKPGIWSIPKGLQDPGETLVEAAVRELYEETSLRVELSSDDTLQWWELIPMNYKTGKKTLHPFILRMARKGQDVPLECTSMVNLPGKAPFKEVDRFEWMDMARARVALHEAQARCFDLIERIQLDPENIKNIVDNYRDQPTVGMKL